MRESLWPRIGWRNLGRNRRRTSLTAIGLGVGYFACVFVVGWSEGIMSELVENATSLVSGQIEIHDAEYRPDRSLYDTIGGREGADHDRCVVFSVSTTTGVPAAAWVRTRSTKATALAPRGTCTQTLASFGHAALRPGHEASVPS